MKITQLPMGARFEYEGKEYVKTGPMFGTAGGARRLIPKYAVVKPVGEMLIASTKTKDTLARGDVLTAFDQFYAACASLVPVPRLMLLQKARENFMQTLG